MSAPYSAVPAHTGETTRDLQDRIARFARTIFVISGVMLVASVTADLALGIGVGGVSRPSRILHVLAQALIFFVWRFCRGRTRSQAILEGIDAALTHRGLLSARWILRCASGRFRLRSRLRKGCCGGESALRSDALMHAIVDSSNRRGRRLGPRTRSPAALTTGSSAVITLTSSPIMSTAASACLHAALCPRVPGSYFFAISIAMRSLPAALAICLRRRSLPPAFLGRVHGAQDIEIGLCCHARERTVTSSHAGTT